jgi:hypothetical protein
MDTIWIVLFASCVAFSGGFMVAAIMAAGSRADEQDYTGDQGIDR